jgi:hypothetical protein
VNRAGLPTALDICQPSSSLIGAVSPSTLIHIRPWERVAMIGSQRLQTRQFATTFLLVVAAPHTRHADARPSGATAASRAASIAASSPDTAGAAAVGCAFAFPACDS